MKYLHLTAIAFGAFGTGMLPILVIGLELSPLWMLAIVLPFFNTATEVRYYLLSVMDDEQPSPSE